METNYPKAYTEVMQILEFVPRESFNKIPKTMIDTFESKMDKDYHFTVDINKTFEEQELLDETKAILANIFRDYWATPYQKTKIEAKEKWDRQTMEEDKKAKYNPDDLFEKKEKDIEKTEINTHLPMEVKKEKFFEKVLNFLKKLFHIEVI